jgi:outer membrane protein OmpA-like peptidoglycan-associated protein
VLDKGSWTLALAATLSLPTGEEDAFLGSGGVAFAPRLIAGVETPVLSVATNLGARLRKNSSLELSGQTVAVGNELFASLGAAAPLPGNVVDLVGDLYLALALDQQDEEEVPAEALAGIRVHLPGDIIANVGAGPGLTRGIGTPAFRVTGGLAYGGARAARGTAPKRPRRDPDADRDRVIGAADRCPEQSEDRDGFRDGDGCPDPDNDGDRITDAGDKCPDDPEDGDSFEDLDGCPDPDNDGDQLADAADACPNEPEDRDGVKDDDGCVDADNDADGLADAQDRCPNEPETFNGATDDDGCPDKGSGPVQITGRAVTAPPVFFATKNDLILKKSFANLLLVAKILRDNAWIKKIRVEGHTDGQGDDAVNLELSQRRATSVMQFLVDNGVEQSRIAAEGFGETQPLATNRTAGGRARNRRVEFIIVDPAGAETPPTVN